MSTQDSDDKRQLIQKWVETWRQAGPELDAVRLRDAEAVSVQEAIRQIFEGMDFVFRQPGLPTSGLVEQQMWFRKIRAKATK